jgi:O-antigen ligase
VTTVPGGARAEPAAVGGQVGDLPLRAIQLGLLGTAAVLGLAAGIDPKLAVVGALGLAFTFLVMSDLAIGVCLFTVLSFLGVLPIAGAPVTFAKAIGLLLALAWFAVVTTDRAERRDFLTTHTSMSLVLLGLLAWAALSITWAESPGDAFETTYRLALNAMLFLIVFTAVATRKHVVWVLAAFLLGAAVSALYGIVFPAPPDSIYDIERLGGAGADPNELAFLMVASIAIAGAFAVWQKAPLVRIAAFAVIGFCTATIFLSVSRSGLVSMGVALLAAVVIGGRWRKPALALLVIMTVSAFGYFTFYASPEVRERITLGEGGSGRTDIWSVGWRMVEDKPVAGVGAGNFQVSSIHYLLEPGAIQRDEYIVDHPKVAHNIYLQVLAELGVVGLALLLAILAFSLVSAFRAARSFSAAGDTRMELLARATVAALLAILAANFFLSEIYSKQLWLLLALGPAMLAIARAERPPTTSPAPGA